MFYQHWVFICSYTAILNVNCDIVCEMKGLAAWNNLPHSTRTNTFILEQLRVVLKVLSRNQHHGKRDTRQINKSWKSAISAKPIPSCTCTNWIRGVLGLGNGAARHADLPYQSNNSQSIDTSTLANFNQNEVAHHHEDSGLVGSSTVSLGK
jgi:hypothetical protein